MDNMDRPNYPESITLRQLVDDPALDLAVVAGTSALDRAPNWVHVSELSDPTPFLEGGELLLTTGLRTPSGRRKQHDYVRRLHEAGVVGLGFGTGLTHAAVPQAMIEAADECGFPVIEVPKATPFLAISKTVSRALAAADYATQRRAFDAQQALTSAAVRPDGIRAVIRKLASVLDARVVLYDQAGAVSVAVPAAAPTVDIGTLRRGSAVFTVDGDEIFAQTLGTGSRVRGILAVGVGGSMTTADRTVVNTAASLLTLALEQSRAMETAERELRSAVWRMLLIGQTDHARQVWGDLPAEPVRLMVFRGDTSAVSPPAGFHAYDGNDLIVLSDQRSEIPGTVGGGSTVEKYERIAGNYRQALAALDHAQRTGSAFSDFADIGVLSVLDQQRSADFAMALLEPLVAHDEHGRGELLRSLRVWLEHHGQWDPAAAQLGVHRHTLRYRMRKVSELLGTPLDSADVRAQLWLALQIGTMTEPALY